jgi:hypothetical protein
MSAIIARREDNQSRLGLLALSGIALKVFALHYLETGAGIVQIVSCRFDPRDVDGAGCRAVETGLRTVVLTRLYQREKVCVPTRACTPASLPVECLCATGVYSFSAPISQHCFHPSGFLEHLKRKEAGGCCGIRMVFMCRPWPSKPFRGSTTTVDHVALPLLAGFYVEQGRAGAQAVRSCIKVYRAAVPHRRARRRITTEACRQ